MMNEAHNIADKAQILQQNAAAILATEKYVKMLPAGAPWTDQLVVVSSNHYCTSNGMSDADYEKLFSEGMKTGNFIELQKKILSLSIRHSEIELKKPNLSDDTRSKIQFGFDTDRETLEAANTGTMLVPLSNLRVTPRSQEPQWLQEMNGIPANEVFDYLKGIATDKQAGISDHDADVHDVIIPATRGSIQNDVGGGTA